VRHVEADTWSCVCCVHCCCVSTAAHILLVNIKCAHASYTSEWLHSTHHGIHDGTHRDRRDTSWRRRRHQQSFHSMTKALLSSLFCVLSTGTSSSTMSVCVSYYESCVCCLLCVSIFVLCLCVGNSPASECVCSRISLYLCLSVSLSLYLSLCMCDLCLCAFLAFMSLSNCLCVSFCICLYVCL